MIYTPDRWVVLQLTSPLETCYTVLATWTGGFATGSNWRLASGIMQAVSDGDVTCFTSLGGKQYYCSTDCWGLSGLGSEMLEHFKEIDDNIVVTVLPENTNYLELNYD